MVATDPKLKKRGQGESGSRPTRKRKAGSDTHVVEISLKLNQREAKLIDQRLYLVGMLRNSILQSLTKAADELFSSQAWKDAKALPRASKQERIARSKTLKALRYDAGLYRDGANRIAHKHWQAGPYYDLLDSWSALALGAEVWTTVEQWLFGKRGRPKFKRSDQRNVAWGNGIKCGIRMKDGCLVWQTAAIQRAPKGSKLSMKKLEIPLNHSQISSARREHLENCKLLRIGIRREQVRGQNRYVALLCVDGLPYRNEAYLEEAAKVKGKAVGLDMNVSNLGVATMEEAHLLPLCDPQLLKDRKKEKALERRRRRAVQRSRRNNNSHAFRRDGSHVDGARPRNMSKRGQRKQDELTNSQRRATEHRKQDRATLAHDIRLMGSELVIESANYHHWHKRELKWAKRLGLTSPGYTHQALKREAEITGGSMREIDPWQNASTQHCLCGRREKKDGDERWHSCSHCGLEAHRDILPAYLACLLERFNKDSLDQLLPVEAHALGVPPDLRGPGRHTSGSGSSHAAGENKKVTRGTDLPGGKTSHSATPARGFQAGWCAKDGSDPQSRRPRHQVEKSSHMSGEFSAAGKANQKKSDRGKEPPLEAPSHGP